MPEINLLKDTKQGNNSQQKKSRRVPPAPVALSSPERSNQKVKPLKKPSGPALWFRSLFQRLKSGKAPAVGAPPPPTIPKPAKPQSSTQPRQEPQDIFSDIASISGGPEAKKTGTPPERPAPTGPQPGAFPPLPRIPPAAGISKGALNRPSGFLTIQRFLRTPSPPSPPLPRMRIPPAQPPRAQPSPDEEEFSGVNLLPEELVTTFEPKKKLTTIGLAALATALVIGILDVSLLLWKETQVLKTEQKRAEVTETLRKISALEGEQRKAILLKSSNDIIRQLLNRHVYWTKFLENFERYTLPTVFYPGGLTVSVGGGISLTGIAPDIETVAQQLAVYQKAADFIKDMKIDSISRNPEGGGYGFVADFTFLPDVYYDPVDEATTAGQGTGSTGTNTNSGT